MQTSKWTCCCNLYKLRDIQGLSKNVSGQCSQDSVLQELLRLPRLSEASQYAALELDTRQACPQLSPLFSKHAMNKAPPNMVLSQYGLLLHVYNSTLGPL